MSSTTKLFVKGSNRKLYDKQTKRYCTLKDLYAYLMAGNSLTIRCQKTKLDITEQVLVSMIPAFFKFNANNAINLLTKGTL